LRSSSASSGPRPKTDSFGFWRSPRWEAARRE
jgi:hypothetical protein